MDQMVIGRKVQEMFGSIAERYDRANNILSFGMHHLWRQRFFHLLPKAGSLRTLDVCTGTGDLLPPLAQRYAKVVGLDFSLPMLQSGAAKWQHLPNVSVVQGDALNMPFADHSFDLVTVAFGVRNFESLERGLAEIHRVLVPGGMLSILEFGQPPGKIWSHLFNLYSKVIMPFVGGLITGNRAAYTYLPETSKYFPCREQFVEILRSAGFEECHYESCSSGIAYIYGGKAI